MINFLYRILFGFLRVSFYGDLKERALTLCAQNGITLWNNLLRNGNIECNILVRDFKYLRSIIRGKGVRVHILKKRGVPFIVNRYRKRSGILVGAVLFFVILELMSGYIWIIDIEGNKRVSDREILSACQEVGLKVGIRKESFYPKLKREELLLKLPDVAWGSVNIEGSRLTVNITETKENSQQKNLSNLKSDFDGIIEKIDITSGMSMVKVGQAVKKGDLLVSGIIETADGTRFVKSRGKVLALTQEELIFKEAYSQKHLIPTGRVKNKVVLQIFSLKIPLYIGRERGNFSTSKKEKSLKLYGADLPVKIYEKRFDFLRSEQVKYSYDELCSLLEKRLQKKLQSTEKGELVNREFIKTEGGVTLKAIIEEHKNIAKEDILLISAGN